jgi:hypothetical protein
MADEQPVPETPAAADPVQDELKPSHYMLGGLGCYGIGVLLFLVFWWLEFTAGSARVPTWLALLYTIGGKWLVAGLGAAMGTLCIGVGAWKLVNPPKP